MTEVDLESVRHFVEILRMTKAQKAKLKELEDNARGAVEAAMGEHEVGLLDGEPAIQWPRFKESRFDSAAFRDEYPDLYETFKAAREKRRFDVV